MTGGIFAKNRYLRIGEKSATAALVRPLGIPAISTSVPRHGVPAISALVRRHGIEHGTLPRSLAGA
eukprot:CAMPEP_0197721000 /NCGR_PEP_ID=MMETSP1434-20131217/4193_1 /TAXON_ID=265543 /ORGANISM="Minutocellus polymorphus, Strain CCMP3303" /LENGTH=65 /DNA_ID=CAMNT_0043305939 /DNA_START=224 /DNA_END=418 /DNA_ORIENTATION=-